MNIIDVTAAVIEKDGLFFCARRAPHKPMAGLWEFPGGKIEDKESYVGCLERELKEEFSIQAKVIKFLLTTRHHYENQVVVLHVYRVAHLSGEFICTDHDQFQWLPLSELDTLHWSEADLPIILYLKQQQR